MSLNKKFQRIREPANSNIRIQFIHVQINPHANNSTQNEIETHK